MKTTLHITNGDNFTEKLKKLKFSGDIVTWREMLCEGKTINTVGSESFWRTRFEFLSTTYKVSKNWFVEKTLKEYRSLCNHKKSNEIILWFEYDLFCQINMLAVISWLKTHRRHTDIFLVCGSESKDSHQLRGLSEMTQEELKQLYQNKIWLTQDDIEFADYVWQLYCSDNPIRLEQLSHFENYQFTYLGKAVEAHLKRFPFLKTGLNQVEHDVLKTALNTKPKNIHELVGSALKNQGLYGFGDLQYERIISDLKPLFSSLSPLKVNNLGMATLEEQANVYQNLQQPDYYLGGTLKYNFLFNQESCKIMKL